MCDAKDGNPDRLLDPPYLPLHLLPQPLVQGAERLIQNEQRRIENEGAGKRISTLRKSSYLVFSTHGKHC